MEMMPKVWRMVLGYGCLALWFLLEVDGLFPQFQIYMFNGRVPFYTVTLKVALVLLLLLVALLVTLRGEPSVPRGILLLWWAFVAYLVVDALILMDRFPHPLTYIVFSYNVYYFFLMLVPLMFFLSGALSERAVVFWVGLLFVPLAVLALAQNLTGGPIVSVRSVDRVFEVQSWGFYGSVRGFSLFSSAFNFGYYVALAGALGVALLCRRRTDVQLVAGLILVALAAAAGFTTLTRTAYLGILMAMAAAYLLVRFRGAFSNLFILLLPVVYGLIGVFLTSALPALAAGLSSTSNLFVDENIIVRQERWAFYEQEWLGDDVFTALFGTGISQQQRFPVAEYGPIDNSFLALGVHVGLVGLVLWVLLMWALWTYVLKLSRERGSPLTIAVAAAWSTWAAIGVFNIALAQYPLLLMLLLLGLAGREDTPPDEPEAQGLSQEKKVGV